MRPRTEPGEPTRFVPLCEKCRHERKWMFNRQWSWKATSRHHTFAVPVGRGLLVVVPADGHALVLHLLHLKAHQDLLQVLHNVWEGRAQLGVHLAGTRGSTRLSQGHVNFVASFTQTRNTQKLHNFPHVRFNCNCDEWIIKGTVGEFYGFYGSEEAPRVFYTPYWLHTARNSFSEVG